MDLEKTIGDLWRKHKWKVICAIIGFVFAVMVISYGFWKALFVCLCIVAGIFIGKKIDAKGDLKTSMQDFFRND